MSCFHLAFKTSPSVKTMSGLIFREGFLELDKEMYGCCGGIGQYEVEQRTTICDLSKNLHYARQALKGVFAVNKRFKYVPKELPPSLSSSLGHLASGRSFRGKIFTRVLREKQPVLFEDIALAAAWVYGIKVHFVKIGETDVFTMVRKIQDSSSANPNLILVRGLRALSNPNYLQDFMVLADFAYNSMVPFWVEVVVNSKLAAFEANLQNNPRSFKTKLSSKVQKSLLEQLPVATKEKLLSFCKEINYKDYMYEPTKT